MPQLLQSLRQPAAVMVDTLPRVTVSTEYLHCLAGSMLWSCAAMPWLGQQGKEFFARPAPHMNV